MIKSIGDMGLEEANHANVPVNISIYEPEESETAWELHAGNYMPRKNWIADGQYHYIADSREELMNLVQQYIVPLYERALNRLKNVGDLYYWENKNENQKTNEDCN